MMQKTLLEMGHPPDAVNDLLYNKGIPEENPIWATSYCGVPDFMNPLK